MLELLRNWTQTLGPIFDFLVMVLGCLGALAICVIFALLILGGAFGLLGLLGKGEKK